MHAGESVSIEDIEVPHIRHDFRETSDDKGDWDRLMNAISDGIGRGEMTKVVASREVQFTSDTPFNVASILANLVENNPNCFIFGYEKDGRTFVGASPEIWCVIVVAKFLAMHWLEPRQGWPDAWTKEQLLSDKKNLFEHNIVRDRIVDIMNLLLRRL